MTVSFFHRIRSLNNPLLSHPLFLLENYYSVVYTIKSHPSFKHTSSSENYINWHIFLNCCGTGVIVRIGKIASKGNIYRSNKLYIFINESYVRVMYIYDLIEKNVAYHEVNCKHRGFVKSLVSDDILY